MDRKTGMIITIAAAVIFGCCGLFSCFGGIATMLGGGTYTSDFGTPTGGEIPPMYGLGGICFGIIFIAIPVISYFLLVHNKPANPPGVPPTM